MSGRRRYNGKSVTVVTAPESEPFTLSDAKAWLKVDSSDEDTIITEMITAVRTAAEAITRRAFITQTLRLTLDFFPSAENDYIDTLENLISKTYNNSDRIWLLKPPIQSITSITTYNTANTSAVFSSSNYTLDADGEKVFLNEGASFPTDLRPYKAIEVVYVAGYGDEGSDMPVDLIIAMKQHLMQMYESRTLCKPPAACMEVYNRYAIKHQLAL